VTARATRADEARSLSIDRLVASAVIEAVVLEDFRVGEAPIRRPHRHDYHELIWIREGRGEHRIDGRPLAVEAGTVTVIGRGQVHQFRHAEGLRGGVLRFGEEALFGGVERILPGRLLAGAGGRAIRVPDDAGFDLDAVVAMLAAESRRPPDAYSADAGRHLLSTLLLWLERWYDAMRTEQGDDEDADVQLHRRFSERLELDFAAHHDARHYADALRVPGPALARVLARRTGRTTKEHVLDRVMLEGARLLRYTDLTVGEIAHRIGFRDPLYFSRAFRRHVGEPPQAYRDTTRGATS
jgi:AraC family transcriptional activator of pobA